MSAVTKPQLWQTNAFHCTCCKALCLSDCKAVEPPGAGLSPCYVQKKKQINLQVTNSKLSLSVHWREYLQTESKAERILIELLFLAHVADSVFESSDAPDPALRLFRRWAVQVQTLPPSTKHQREAPRFGNGIAELTQALGLATLPHTLHLRHADWERKRERREWNWKVEVVSSEYIRLTVFTDVAH